MLFKRMVMAAGLAWGILAASAAGQTPDVLLSVVDTCLYPGAMNGRYLTVRMNTSVKIGGYQVGLMITNPQFFNFSFFDVDTTLPYWQYFTDCTPLPCHPDSVLTCPDTCYFFKSDVKTAGTLSEGADVIVGSRLSAIYLQVTCLYQYYDSPGPAIQPGEGILFQVPLGIVPIADTVPLSGRQTQILIDPFFTYFSDSTGYITYGTNDPVNLLHTTNGTVCIPYSIKGDMNFDGLLNSSDVVRLTNYAFLMTNPPSPGEDVADVNCDGSITSSDVVIELNRVFLGLTDPPWCGT